MPRCVHKGCGQDYDESTNSDDSCLFHPGAPVFHEGLKSWSCCNTANKPVLDFDEFMRIQGCTRGSHSAEEAKSSSATAPTAEHTQYATDELKDPTSDASSNKHSQPATPPAERMAPMASVPNTVAEEEEEDLDAIVPSGATCRHNGCQTTFSSDEENRIGDGPGTLCTYHSGLPVFHEGSKGYFCCKRRVLEFDEFLKIEGCKLGRHVFVPKKTSKDKEELVTCRLDHYQTPSTVHVSVYAKQTNKDRSVVHFEENRLVLDLILPDSKRFSRTIELFGTIDPATSAYKILGTKVEITLSKKDGRSWTLLEKTDRDLGSVAFTFGVSGRTGTVGARQAVLDKENARK